IEEMISGEPRYFIRPLPKKRWSERNPILDKIVTGLITAIFSLGVGVLLYQMNNREKDRDNSQQNQQLNRLSDSLKILENNLADSDRKSTRLNSSHDQIS